ncbi:MAG: hypothetical protein M0R03_10020 [Novosphingobium sp.]|nr:hypothetical protein [Novosphingobium sp.]
MERVNRLAAGAAAALLAMLLTGCLLMPGKFTSTLDLRRDGTFAFTYTGEITAMALSDMARREMTGKTFTPAPCYQQDATTERACSRAEIEEQRKSWQDERDKANAKKREESEAMAMMFGGLDLNDPRAGQELAERLRKQAGWRQADYRGDGRFVVDFTISGRLDHDFLFPTIERLPSGNAFVQVNRRSDGTVRVDAPGYTEGSGNTFVQAMMGAASTRQSGQDANAATMPKVEGTFVLRTDGAILANNTNDGPQQGTTGQTLTWRIGGQIGGQSGGQSPMALIRLAE